MWKNCANRKIKPKCKWTQFQKLTKIRPKSDWNVQKIHQILQFRHEWNKNETKLDFEKMLNFIRIRHKVGQRPLQT